MSPAGRLLPHAPVLLPLAVLCVVTAVGFVVPTSIHTASLLVAVPALTAGFVRPRFTALITALACLAAAGLDIRDGLLHTAILPIHVIDVLVVGGLVIVFWHLRFLDSQALYQVRSVAETAQRALLRPLPRRIGQVRIASVYRSAAAQAQIGGDLYAAARTRESVRLIIGDVRGNGLSAVDDAAAVLSSFREAAHRDAPLPELTATLEGSVQRHLEEVRTTDSEGDERFITALILEIPDEIPEVRIVSCGHPPPMMRPRAGPAELLRSPRPAPPLGLGGSSEDYVLDTFRLEPEDTLLLHTDGLLEARDAAGDFYPAFDRFASLSWCDPDQLLQRLVADLLDYAQGSLEDDVALVAVERLPEAGAHSLNEGEE